MAAINPISLNLTTVALADFSSFRVGDLMPVLLRINMLLDQHLARIDENLQSFTTRFESMLVEISVLENGQLRVLGTSLRVYETNPDVLDHIQAGRWAIAYLSYNLMVDVLSILESLRYRAGQIVARLDTLHNDLVGIAYEITAMGNCICSTLQAILELLRSGLRVNGVLVIQVNAGSLGDILKDLDLSKLWELLGIAALGVLVLAAALAVLAGFVYLLGLALSSFTPTAILAMTVLGGFLTVLKDLAVALAAMSFGDIATLTAGLAALAGFVYALALALKQMSADVLKALPGLTSFIGALKDLAAALAAMSIGDIATLTAGLAALGGFVYALGVALNKMSADVLNALPNLNGFIAALKDLAVALAAMSFGDIATLTAGLAALGGFVYALGVALNQMTADVLNALPALSSFVDTLKSLATTLAAMSFGDIATLTAGLAALGGFVYALGAALKQMSAQVLNALPALTSFVETLKNLAVTLAGMSAADIAGLVVALAALGGFVYALGAALNQMSAQVLNALPGLSSFVDTLRNLATALAAMSAADIAGLVVGLGALAGFVYVLTAALNQLNGSAVQALPALSTFINSLVDLAKTLAGMTILDLLGMAFGLAVLAGFIYLLGAALNTFSQQVLDALPALANLLTTLNTLVVTVSGLGIGELLAMGAAFALIAGFVFLLAMAVDTAAPGLIALGGVLSGLNGLVNTVSSGVSGLASGLKALGGFSIGLLGGLGGGILGGLGGLLSFQTGGVMPYTGPAMLHAGERVLNVEETQALAGAGGGLAGGAAGGMDNSVHVEGGITVNIQAGNLDSGSAAQLSDEIIRQLQERLGALRAEQDFRTGTRLSAPA